MEYFNFKKNNATMLTVLAIAYYGCVLSFHLGYAALIGFPREYINIDLSIMVYTSACLLMIFFYMVKFLDLMFLIKPYNIKYIVITALSCGWFFNSVVFGSYSGINPLRGVFEFHCLLVYLFSLMVVYLIVKTNNFLKSLKDENIYVSKLILLLTIFATTFALAGAVYATLPVQHHIRSDGYVAIVSYSDGIVFAKCIDNKKHFIRVSKNNGDILIKEKGREYYDILNCGDGGFFIPARV